MCLCQIRSISIVADQKIVVEKKSTYFLIGHGSSDNMNNLMTFLPAAAAAVVYGYASNPAYCPGYGAAAAAATAFCCKLKRKTEEVTYF